MLRFVGMWDICLLFEMAAVAQHSNVFGRRNPMRRNVGSSWEVISMISYMACPLTRCVRMPLPAAASCAAMFFGVCCIWQHMTCPLTRCLRMLFPLRLYAPQCFGIVCYIRICDLPADALGANDFGRCGLMRRCFVLAMYQGDTYYRPTRRAAGGQNWRP